MMTITHRIGWDDTIRIFYGRADVNTERMKRRGKKAAAAAGSTFSSSFKSLLEKYETVHNTKA